MLKPEQTLRLASSLGMASLWAFLLSDRRFPVSLAIGSNDTVALLSFYILYGVALVVACSAALYGAYRRPDRPSSPLLLCATGAAGALGIGGLIAFGETTALAGVCACLVACYTVAHLLFWTDLFRRRADRDAAVVDAAFSILLFCGVSALASAAGLSADAALALLPLASTACALVAQSPPIAATVCTAHSRETGAGRCQNDECTPPLIARILIPCIIYFYLARAMDVGLDFLSMLPIDSFRLIVFALAAASSLVVATLLVRRNAPMARRLTDAFTAASACLLLAMFATCCQTMGYLPLGNYAVVVVKIMLAFFIWLLFTLVPPGENALLETSALLTGYLMLIVWLPNFIHSALLALASVTETATELSGIFVAVSAVALVTSVISSATISSFVSRPKDVGDKEDAGTGIADAPESTPKGATPPQPESAPETPATADLQAIRLAEFQHAYGLSDREIEIVRLTCEGKTAKRIASELFIAETTVYTHQKNIYHKVNVHSKQELMDAVEGFTP